MYNIEVQYLELLDYVKNNYEGVSTRETRSGTVNSTFSAELSHRGVDGFPLLTTKKVNFSAIVGELLWFLSGKCDLPSLRHLSDIKENGNTIWTGDYEDYKVRVLERFGEGYPFAMAAIEEESLGLLYGNQWRNFGGSEELGGTDQIKNLIKSLKSEPNSRRHIVTSYDPTLTDLDYALPPCHLMFQCFVDCDKKLSLKYTMRSNDLFLGAPFNIASYALLQAILAKLTGLEVGDLYASLGDAHTYKAHDEAIDEQLMREPLQFCQVELPDFKDLDDLASGKYTAKDFKLINYKSHSPIKAPLQTQIK